MDSSEAEKDRRLYRQIIRAYAATMAGGELERPDQYVDDILRESERGCVLVAAAYIDDAIAELLTAFFKRNSDINQKKLGGLFKFDLNPLPLLGSLGNKITIAHAIGLIDSRLHIPLNKIRKVRNTFAHNPERAKIGKFPMPLFPALFAGIDDDSDENVDRFFIEDLSNLANNLPNKQRLNRGRVHFMLTASTVLGYLRAQLANVEAGAFDFTPNPPHPPASRLGRKQQVLILKRIHSTLASDQGECDSSSREPGQPD